MAPKPAIEPTQAAHAKKPIPQMQVPIIEHTKPAVAIPVGLFFLAIAPRIIPTIPTIIPIHPAAPKNVHTRATIPNTNDATPTTLPPFDVSLTMFMFSNKVHY